MNAANILLSLTHMHGSKFSVKFCNSQPLFTLIKSRLTLDSNVNNNRLWDQSLPSGL